MGEISPVNEFKDLENPRSIINLVPPTLKKTLSAIPDEWLGRDEGDFLEHVQPKVTPVLRRLRQKFWEEYNHVQEKNLPQITVGQVVRGICSSEHFFREIAHNPKSLAYILIPTCAQKVAYNDGIHLSLSSAIKWLENPPVEEDGKPGYKTMETILKYLQFFHTALHGSAVQRIEQKNLNLNIDTSKQSELSLDDVKKRLQELEQKSPEPKPIKDVTSE